MSERTGNDFERASAEESSTSLVGEFWGFLKDNQKWWLLPIVAALLLLGALALLTASPLAPFIYTLF